MKSKAIMTFLLTFTIFLWWISAAPGANGETVQPGSTSSVVSTECGTNAVLVGGTCQCSDGFAGDGQTCQDINECLTSPCAANADCTNTDGSYTCTCKAGYTGDGFTCALANPCEYSNPCPENADCQNKDDTAVCTCKTGYTGDNLSCTDINECTSGGSNCDTNAICTNTEGSFTCTCNAGYSGDGTTCTNIDECSTSTHDCDVNADCTDTIGSFTCTCKSGYNGDGKECFEDILLQTAQTTAESDVKTTSTITTVETEESYYVGDSWTNTFHISSNGLVSFPSIEYGTTGGILGTKITSQSKVFAPFWANIQLTSSGVTNKLHYRIHRKGDGKAKTSDVFTRANQYIHGSSANDGNFAATFALVVTWNKVLPAIAQENPGQEATFQFALISDGLKTYVMYIYPGGSMKWLDRNRHVIVGYSVTGLGEYSLNQYSSGSFPFDFNKITFPGLTRKGIFVVQVGNVNQNPTLTCLEIYNKQPATAIIESMYTKIRDCPPTYERLNVYIDQFQFIQKIVDEQGDSVMCYKSLYIFSEGGYQIVEQCCYRQSVLVFFQEVTLGPLGVGVVTNDLIVDDSALEENNRFFDQCCRSGFPALCSKFEEKRFRLRGTEFDDSVMGLCFGDPHISTVDGKDYTYNGLGDFVVLKAMGTANNFTIHGRTKRPFFNETEGSQGTNATIFSGFAMTEQGASVFEVHLNITTQEMSLKINNLPKDITMYKNATNENGTFITYVAGEKISFFFKSLVGVIVTKVGSLLKLTLQLPKSTVGKTRGLMGVYNGNQDDDFTTPTGAIVNINSTQERIFYDFGNTWALSEEKSLFSIKVVAEAFTPEFAQASDMTTLFGNENTALLSQAIATCGGNGSQQSQCLFDIYMTNDLKVGQGTQESVNTFSKEKEVISQAVPFIQEPMKLFMEVGRNYSFQIKAFSNNSEAKLSFSVQATGFIFNVEKNTGQLNITLPSPLNISLQFTVTDLTNNISTILVPQVRLCHCVHGTCLLNSTDLFSIVNGSRSSYVGCNCDSSYSGTYCDQYVDPCITQPCFLNVTCTSSGSSRTCASCPSKYSGNGIMCYDVNECSVNSPCEHNCTNFIGGFNCSCLTGYQLVNSSKCIDIDECKQSVCSPNAVCTNSPGNYSCTCKTGYTGDGKICTDLNECLTKPCQQTCSNTVGSFRCSCNPGFTESGLRCNDINECNTSTHNCNSNANCYNLPGAFFCLCKQGFSGDGKQCIALRTSTAVTAIVRTSFIPTISTTTSPIASTKMETTFLPTSAATTLVSSSATPTVEATTSVSPSVSPSVEATTSVSPSVSPSVEATTSVISSAMPTVEAPEPTTKTTSTASWAIPVGVTLGICLILIILLILFGLLKRRRKSYTTADRLREGNLRESESIWSFIHNRLRARVRDQQYSQYLT